MKTTRAAAIACFIVSAALFSSRAPAEEAKPITISGITFKPGASWISKEATSSMRAAELEIKPDGAEAPLTAVFYYFGPGQGGSVEANVERWLGQFEGDPAKETKEHKFDDKTVTIIHAKGTYLESMGGPFAGPKTPREGWAMLGAIVPGADAYVYIKLTGKEKDVAAIAEQFTALSTSPFKKD